MTSPSETSALILGFSNEQLKAQTLFERYNALESIGMLPDEERIGHPERPYKQWTSNDFKAVLALFNGQKIVYWSSNCLI